MKYGDYLKEMEKIGFLLGKKENSKKISVLDLQAIYALTKRTDVRNEIQRRQRAMLFRALAKLADNNGKNQFAVAAELADLLMEDVLVEDSWYDLPAGVIKPRFDPREVDRVYFSPEE